jgi:hypothetical protein
VGDSIVGALAIENGGDHANDFGSDCRPWGLLEAISSLAERELLAVAAVESSERPLALFRVACQELA